MPTRHKHADLIIAWANGAIIQGRDTTGKWITLSSPGWTASREYRIKPKVKKYKWVYTNNKYGGIGITGDYYSDEKEFAKLTKYTDNTAIQRIDSLFIEVEEE